MGRKPNKTDAQKKLITPSAGSGKEAPYFRVYADLFYSDAFQRLSPKARLLYIDMAIESRGTMEPFTFPRRKYKKRYSPEGFKAAKDQLHKAGFIDESGYYGQDHFYTLSGEWMRKSLKPCSPTRQEPVRQTDR